MRLFLLLFSIQLIANEDPYFVTLGYLSIPLTPGRENQISIDYNQLIGSLDKDIHFYKGDKKLDFEVAFLSKMGSSRRSGLWYSNFDLEHSKIPNKIFYHLRNNLLPGDGITLALRLNTEEFSFFSVDIYSIDHFENYMPEIFPADLDYSMIYAFQMLEESGSPVTIKLDTTSLTTLNIYAMYKGKTLYKVIHIPQFKTHRRYLGNREKLFDSKSIRSVYSICDQFNPQYLPELTWLNKEKPELNWGSYPLGKGYNLTYVPLDNLKSLFYENLYLKNCEDLILVQFEIIIVRPGFDPVSIISNSVHESQVAKLFSTLQEGSSVYFKNLILIDQYGKPFLNPESYSFHIPFAPKFKLDISINECPEISFSEKNEHQWSACGVGFESLLKEILNPSYCFLQCENMPHFDFSFEGDMEESKKILFHKIQAITGFYRDSVIQTIHCLPKIPEVHSYAIRSFPE